MGCICIIIPSYDVNFERSKTRIGNKNRQRINLEIRRKIQMIKLADLLKEEVVQDKAFEQFADKRMSGAEKIANNAHEKGGVSMLTYHHFIVKMPYYKKAKEGKMDIDEAKKEFEKTLKKISLSMSPVEFQKEVGRLEVLGELIIKNK